MDIAIRDDFSADHAAIAGVHRLAFGGEDEGRLVEALRAAGLVTTSLVAEDAGRVVGHILFSTIAIRGADGVTTALAIVPGFQLGGSALGWSSRG